MKKRLLLTALLVLSVSILTLPSPAMTAPVTIYYASPTGNDTTGTGGEVSPWRTISYAVSQASDDDTIKVMDDDNESTADYTEKIVVNKSLTIERYNGSGANPQVKASSTSSHVFQVTANNVAIRGLDICGADDTFMAGIYLNRVSGCTIENNSVGWDHTTQTASAST